jgi:hypothetical protein
VPGILGYLIIGLACAYIIVFNVIYTFPHALPVDAAYMNYSCLMVGGLSIFVTLWDLWKRIRGYNGPRVLLDGSNDALKGIIGP